MIYIDIQHKSFLIMSNYEFFKESVPESGCARGHGSW